jgi:hypothetical protein
MYPKRFLNILKFIFQWECVFKRGHDQDYDYVTWEDVSGDPGGVTKWGVDQRSHPDLDIKNLTQEQATEVYYKGYWLKYGCDNLADKLGEAYFNCCVNCGFGRAKKILEKSKTAAEFMDNQEAFYRGLVDSKPAFSKFLKGWLNRTGDLRKFLKL